MKFNALDSYESDLALVLAPMPPEKRAHLEAMIEGRRADGQSAESATAEALRAFGASEQIGRELLDEWARGPRMEVRGTPLSKREKWRQNALAVGVMLLVIWLQLQRQGWK